MATAKVWLLKRKFEGEPRLDDFTLKEESLSPLKDGEIQVQTLYLSVDPYFRLLSNPGHLPGEQIARIVESKAPGYPKGGLVSLHNGWRSQSVVNVSSSSVKLLEDVPGQPVSIWLGAVGMPGLTAYIGFYDKGRPKKGETIVVSAAAGAVGNIVGQLAKLEGLVVIGLAGSVAKCDFLKEIGFDYAINYKKENVSTSLEAIAPKGVDIYFDNVGGDITDAVFPKLRKRGRVVICGQISTYNKPQPKVTNWYMHILWKEITVEGLVVSSKANAPVFEKYQKSLLSLVKEGKLKIREHITEGFENMPAAFLGLFSGDNFGKAIVKA